jgi:catechol 2,3-dioxygenase-like lactoylglutathione lyase family enzyme
LNETRHRLAHPGNFGEHKWGISVSAIRPTHIAVASSDRANVRAFHAAGLAAGGRDNGPPGLRPHYHQHYYGAFILDPDGNNIEAVCHRPA